MLKSYLKFLTVFTVALSLIACDLPTSSGTSKTNVVREKSVNNIWDKVADNCQLNTHPSKDRVKHYLKYYQKYDAEDLVKYSERATPYIYHIVQMLEERGMPVELALLPIIESEYQPFATSKRGAAGIWQLASVTGHAHGLKQDSYHDQRKDIEIATKVALAHLQFLADRYNGDWLLALAAYNAGHGRVEQAMRANKRVGKPCDYWSLNLPKETMHFVPKFLAVSYLVQNSQRLGINLAPIENKPYFTTVTLQKPIDLNKAATMAKLDVKTVKKLNPSIRTNSTPPKGPHKLVLPIKNAYIFRANYVMESKTAAKNKPKAAPPKPKAKAKPKNSA